MSVDRRSPSPTPPETNNSSGDGPSETTLVMYSLFMAVSSIIFGGFSLWHASDEKFPKQYFSIINGLLFRLSRVADNVQRVAQISLDFLRSVDPHTLVWVASMLCLLVLLAFATNPTDNSFRSFLTDLSLHEHLRHFRQDAIESSRRLSIREDSDELQVLARREMDRTLPFVHSFANRISVSLRTPSYDRRDLGLVSIVTVLEQDHLGNLKSRRFFGAFGKWWTGSILQHSDKVIDPQKSKGCSWGVLQMQIRNSPQYEERTSLPSMSGDVNGELSRQDDSNFQDTANEKQSPAKRKKQSSKAKSLHSPLHTSISTKDASTSYDTKVGEDVASGEQTIPSSPVLNNDAGLNTNATERNSMTGHTPTDSTQMEAIAEAQLQLEQLRTASEAARKSLQTQLEEMRSRKKDEDAARLDVKGRMKTLDEHKRQAEGTKREAEKRLKTAKALQESLQNKVLSKTDEMANLRKKEAASKLKVQESAQKKVQQVSELRQRIEEKKEEEKSTEMELSLLKEKLEAMQKQVLEEEGNLQAAREMAEERTPFVLAQMHSGPEYYVHHNPLSYADQYDQFGQDFMHGQMPLDPGHNLGFDEIMNQQQNIMMQLPHQWGNNEFNIGGPVAPQARSLAQMAAMIGDDAETEGLDDAFDPTVSVSGQQRQQTFDVPRHARFSPFSFDSNNIALADGVSGGDVESLSRSRMSSVTPISPFSSDLLPSNLFQNVDEDEMHVGILPGSHSARVEAALNQFGLDTSDTSDAEVVKEDVEGKEKKSDQGRKRAPSSGSRTWWGGRTRSKERVLGDSMIAPLSGLNNDDNSVSSSNNENSSKADVGSLRSTNSEDSGVIKRRSLSIFPKLSLNPGAKSFRGSLRRNASQQGETQALPTDMQETEGKPAEPQMKLARNPDRDNLIMRHAWNSSLGQLPRTQQDFDSVKRAFEADQPTRMSFEVPGKASSEWDSLPNSAFGIGRWPSHLTNASKDSLRVQSDSLMYPIRPLHNQQSEGRMGHTNNVSMENVRTSGIGQRPGPTDWLDEMILPLEKTTSRGSQHSAHSSNAAVRIAPATNKPSRFSLWRNSTYKEGVNDSTNQANDANSTLSSNDQDQSSNHSAANGSAQDKPKRTSFLWSRKGENSSSTTNVE